MERLKNNKAIAMLDRAAEGGYGVPAIVCVSKSPLLNHGYFQPSSASQAFLPRF